LILSFYVPEMEGGSRAAYLRMGRREGMDCALVGVAVQVVFSEMDNGLKSARVVLGAVGPTPLRARRVEAELLSGSFTEERVQAASRLAMGECLPISDHRASGEYRREMVGVLTRRALEKVRGGEERR
jgi:carbon-monoxide dehydrogenase medium subunit